jgi:hypothetical protein
MTIGAIKHLVHSLVHFHLNGEIAILASSFNYFIYLKSKLKGKTSLNYAMMPCQCFLRKCVHPISSGYLDLESCEFRLKNIVNYT